MSVKTIKTPKFTQEQMFEAAHEHAMNSPANEFVRIAIPNLLAVTLVGKNAQVKHEYAERKRKEAETKLTDFKAEMLAGLKEAYGQGDWLNIHLMIQELTDGD